LRGKVMKGKMWAQKIARPVKTARYCIQEHCRYFPAISEWSLR
jgi:hypothetical protein